MQNLLWCAVSGVAPPHNMAFCLDYFTYEKSPQIRPRLASFSASVSRSVHTRQQTLGAAPTAMAAAVVWVACGVAPSRAVSGHHVSVPSHSHRSTASVMVFHSQRRRRALLKAESEMQLIVDEVATDLRRVQDAYMATWRQNTEGRAALAAAYRLSCISPLLDAHLELYEQAQMYQQAQLDIRQAQLIKPCKSISNLTAEMAAPIRQLQLQRDRVREESPRVALRWVSRITSEASLVVEYSEAELSRARALEALNIDARAQAAPRLSSPPLAFIVRNGSEVVKLSPASAAPPRDFFGGVVQTDSTLRETSKGRANESDSSDKATGSSAGG